MTGAHDLAPGSPEHKVRIHSILENHWVETTVVILILIDIALVCVEAGIDHHLLCIDGKVVPYGSPAGHPAVAGTGSGYSGIAAKPAQFPDFLQAQIPGQQVGEAAMRSRARRRQPTRRRLGAGFLDAGLAAVDHPGHEESHGASHEGAHEGSSHEGGHSGDHGEHSHDHHGPPEEVLVCDTREGHTAHHISHTCHTWSINILIIFEIELLAKWYVIPGWLNDWRHQLDWFVVTISLIIDALVIPFVNANMNSKDSFELIMGLLIISRLWRVVRIGHGIYEEYNVVKHEIDAGEEAKKENAALKQRLAELERRGLPQAARA